MKRRQFIALLSGAAALWPVRARSQASPPKPPHVGYLSHARLPRLVEAFMAGLGELGYVDGRNIVIDFRWGDGNPETLRLQAQELVRLPVAVIVAAATPAALAAKAATDRIPIVLAPVSDPVSTGLVQSLGQPGGNITGVTLLSYELAQKRLELLREMVPNLKRVAVLANSDNPGSAAEWNNMQPARHPLGVQLALYTVTGLKGWEEIFAAMAGAQTDAVIVLPDASFNAERGRLTALAAARHLPSMYEASEYVEAGGLIAYGPNTAELVRHAAKYVDKILKGAKPADLPIEQPSSFALYVNAKTAAALGLAIPQAILGRADQVIE